MRLPMRLIFHLLFICCFTTNAQVKEPYKLLNGGSYSDLTIKDSPDPIINYKWDAPKASDSLQIYFLEPKKVSTFPPGSFKQTSNSIRVEGTGSIMFDFGVESAGWLEFESDDLVDSVEMSISEYNEPAILNRGAQNPSKTKRPEKYGNLYRLELNNELYEGVRFGWIHIGNFSKPWHIKNVRLVCQTKPVNYIGSFYSNDEELNKIWYTGAYTVKLNLLHDFLGAILMERSDRHSWTGDAYPSQAAALAAFGNYDFIKKNIAFTSDQNNGIAGYSIYWVLGLVEYYNYTGDIDFLKEYIANADNRLEEAYNHYDNLPNLGFTGWDERLGAGFENTQIQEAQNTYRMLCINGWRKFSEAMTSIDETSLAAKYRQFADSKIKMMQADKKIVGQFGIHAVSEAINAGLYEEANIKSLSKKLFNDRLNRLSYSPFNQYFIIQAMALAKENELALTTIKDNWGGQLAYGGTTFFEVFRPSWNAILSANDAPPNNQCGYTSLSHPWGAGVTKWLSENILGIQPVQPGFKSFNIIPFLKDSLTYVKGDMPTTYGVISASFDVESGECKINIPEGTKAETIGLPKVGKKITSIKINNAMYWSLSGKNRQKMDNVEEDKKYVYLKNIPSGRYEIKIDYSGNIKKSKKPIKKIEYKMDEFAQDSLTSGKWIGKYGKDGYVLFGNPNNNESKKLPSYIKSVSTRLNKDVIWDAPGSDTKVLENINSNEKHAAAIITKDPIATLQTMTIDIVANKNKPYQLSMYFLDWDKKDRRSALEIFDLETLKIISPVQMIKHYENGKYLSFITNRSIRIRINHVRGKNAAVSGVFFDNLGFITK